MFYEKYVTIQHKTIPLRKTDYIGAGKEESRAQIDSALCRLSNVFRSQVSRAVKIRLVLLNPLNSELKAQCWISELLYLKVAWW